MEFLPRSVQATLGDDEAHLLLRLIDESGLTRWRWVRGAIRAAAADPAIAQAIVDAAPPDRRGGARPGAGRPRKDKS